MADSRLVGRNYTTADLVAKVTEVGADVGLAYDGDADRVGIVDEKGRRHEADLLLAILARDLLTRHPGAKIIFDVKSSQVLVDDIRRHGGVPVMWKTGHSLLKRKMREDGILLGGSYESGQWDATPDPAVAERILREHGRLFAEMRRRQELVRTGHGLPPA